MYIHIHRQSAQIDPHPSLDLLLMGRKTFDKTNSVVLGVHALDGEWAMGEHFNTQDATDIVRAGGKFFCRLEAVRGECLVFGGEHRPPASPEPQLISTRQHHPQGQPPIPASLVPVHTSLDPNANGIVEIIRCPLPPSAAAQRTGLLDVTYLLQDPPAPALAEVQQQQQEKPSPASPEPYDLLRVAVPRATRTAGFFNYTCVHTFVWVGGWVGGSPVRQP